MRILNLAARLCAILAGVALTLITLIICASIIGRNTVGVTIVGDFELVGVATGAAIALFMPWCQVKRGNIIVDFFTAKASEGTNAALDRLGAVCVALTFALLTWRTGVGAMASLETRSSTMMLGFPEWLIYFSMVPPFLLTVVIALYQAVNGLESLDDPAHHEAHA